VKEKSIYHQMNLFNYDVGRKCLIAEVSVLRLLFAYSFGTVVHRILLKGWVPTVNIDDVRQALRRASERSGSLVPSILTIITTTESPPTYFKTTDFTRAFQDIVESYGVARYREVNPAVFTIITFPFLFAVMFGDFGHGIIMAIVGGLLGILMFASFAFTGDLPFSPVAYEKRLAAAGLSEMAKTMFDGRYVIFFMGLFRFV